MSLLSSFCSNSGAKVRKIFHIRKRIRKNLRIVTKKNYELSLKNVHTTIF